MAEYYGYPSLEHDGLTFGNEKIAPMVDELRELHQQNWDEIEFGYLGLAMDPNYELGILVQEADRLLCFTVRLEDGTLVGNSLFTVGPNLHIKGRIAANEDTFFLAKAYRSKGIAVGWLMYIKTFLKALGVSHMTMTDKSPVGGKSLEPLFTFAGFKKVATLYIADLEGDQPCAAEPQKHLI